MKKKSKEKKMKRDLLVTSGEGDPELPEFLLSLVHNLLRNEEGGKERKEKRREESTRALLGREAK